MREQQGKGVLLPDSCPKYTTELKQRKGIKTNGQKREDQ